jgi:putative two-component system response regulator
LVQLYHYSVNIWRSNAAGMKVMSDAVKILAVDDDVFNLEIIKHMLSEIDCYFTGTLNGREALEVLEANPDTDIILLDLEMPVMDGYETIRRLKQHISWKEIPVIVVTSSANEVTRILALGANDFLTKPYNPDELRLRVMNHVRSKKLTDLTKNMNQILENEVSKKTAALKNALNLSQEAEYEISIRLGKAAEFRDKETGMHTRRISEMSKRLGMLAGLDKDQCEVLYKASPLHDVGKIGIPDKILLKPGKLDSDEFDIMKQHTIIGSTILSDSGRYQLLNAGAVIALQHHEKWDGSGYPHGLKGTDIHEFARIVSIVDVFDALSSERAYKKSFPLEKVIRLMEKDRDVFFDPNLLNLFMKNIDNFIVIREMLEDTP